MPLELNRLTTQRRPNLMFGVLERAKELEVAGHPVVHLEKGEPELGTPAYVVAAGHQALDAGATTLTPSRGTAEVRAAIARYYRERFGVTASPASEVMATPGAKFSLFLALGVLLEPGDEVLCLSPYFPAFRELVELFGGSFVPVPLQMAGPKVQLDLAALAEAGTGRARALILNHPHNPTGWVPTADELEAVVALAARRNLVVLSDEVYHTLRFAPGPHRTILSFPELRDRAIVLDSCSKTFAMTGWRIGYAVGPAEWIAAMAQLQGNTATCPAAPSQYAAAAAFNGPWQGWQTDLCAIYRDRAEAAAAVLAQIPGLRPCVPGGSFFVWIDISSLKVSSLDFSVRLLEREHVAITPGVAFGDEWDGFVRISTTEAPERLAAGLEAMGRFVREGS